MVGGSNSVFGILIGGALGTLFLIPANGLAQQDIFRPDPCSLNVVYMTRLVRPDCLRRGRIRFRSVHPGIDVREWYRRGGE